MYSAINRFKNQFKELLFQLKASKQEKTILLVLGFMLLSLPLLIFQLRQQQQIKSNASGAILNLSVSPAHLNAIINQEFELDVTVDTNGFHLLKSELHLDFNTQDLSLLSLERTNSLPVVFQNSQISSGKGSIVLGALPGQSIAGVSTIAKAKFKVLPQASSNTIVSLNNISTKVWIVENISNAIASNFQSNITISSPLASTPSPYPSVTSSHLSSPLPSRSPSPSPKKSSNPTPTPDSSPESSDIPTEDSIFISPAPTTNPEITLPSPSPSQAVANFFDFNQDGKVNSIDLSVIYQAWGRVKNSEQEKADYNKDKVINGIDYSNFLRNFSLN